LEWVARFFSESAALGRKDTREKGRDVDLLIIDDDLELCSLLVDYLGQVGFSVEVASDGAEGLGLALEGSHSLVVLDVMLPGICGYEVLRRLREKSQVPVIMLTARCEDLDRIVGLEMGADDCIPKPLNPRELVARIRAVQRRSVPPEITDDWEQPLTVGDVTLSRIARRVHKSDRQVSLTSVEFLLLEILLKSAGRIVPREKLAQKALGRPLSPYDRSIDVHISSLRKKLKGPKGKDDRIKTVRGVGYQYIKTDFAKAEGSLCGKRSRGLSRQSAI
jgi:DNA-binding response OmpR family regulator